MNKNQIEGSVKDVTGKIQQKVGHATGSTNQRVKGMAKQIEGKVQKGVGYIEQALDKARRKPRSSVGRILAKNAQIGSCRIERRVMSTTEQTPPCKRFKLHLPLAIELGDVRLERNGKRAPYRG